MIELDRIYRGDSLAVLKTWPDEFVQTVVTSPPYWGLRDYGAAGQMGLEKTSEEYVSKMVEVFREVRRVLRSDGVLWINVGDSYANNGCGGHGATGGRDKSTLRGALPPIGSSPVKRRRSDGLKQKDLVGIPWMLAFALRADGWYLRSDIIWSKPNPMPESVTDRPTKAHEYLFLLSKSERYFYDADAIKEPATETSIQHLSQNIEAQAGSTRANGGAKTNGAMKAVGCKPTRDKQRGHGRRHAGFNDRWDDMERAEQCSGMRNKRTVWTVATQPFSEAHFATFPPKLIEPCILAGSRTGDVVLDPFMGAGTTALVAARLNRRFLGIELNPEYIKLAETRIAPELAQQKLAI